MGWLGVSRACGSPAAPSRFASATAVTATIDATIAATHSSFVRRGSGGGVRGPGELAGRSDGSGPGESGTTGTMGTGTVGVGGLGAGAGGARSSAGMWAAPAATTS
ncbi:hypothetical protein Dvina_16635 [Dactylosporangium vinaceum]|nr:hypothetical protein Dvina_16635 [Dactylosporangium vinaceum]